MRTPVERVLSVLAASTLVACFALPASLSFARHRHVQPGARRHVCEPFEAEYATLTAKAGDTLWSMTERNTGKPWIWPQIWTLNPSMTNPHVLAVGQIISFGRQAQAATRVTSSMPIASGESTGTAEGDAEDAAGAPEAQDGESDAKLAAAPQVTVPPPTDANGKLDVKTEAAPLEALPAGSPREAFANGAPPPTEAVPDTAHLVPAALFSKQEWQRFGTIVKSTQEGMLGGAGEKVTIHWPDSSAKHPGPYAIVRMPEGRGTSDDGHESGRIGSCTGVATALDKHAKQALVRSVREEIEVGQRIAPAAWLEAPNKATQLNPKRVCGHLVGNEHVAIAGNPLHVVFFNRGAHDGLQVGDLVVGEGQGIGHAHHVLLRVLRASKRQSTLSALSATQELEHGQPLCTATEADMREQPKLARQSSP